MAQEVSAIDILAAAEAIAQAQGRVESLLENLISSGKLPPSLVFAGPEGSGKELMAVRLAAKLNCEGGGAGGPAAAGAGGETNGGNIDAASRSCGIGHRCAACAAVRTLEHPDVHIIFPVPHGEMENDLPVVIASRREDFFASGEFRNRARSIGIDLVRRVTEILSKQPFEGRRTVVAFFEAHLATVEAQNALSSCSRSPRHRPRSCSSRSSPTGCSRRYSPDVTKSASIRSRAKRSPVFLRNSIRSRGRRHAASPRSHRGISAAAYICSRSGSLPCGRIPPPLSDS